jgi:ATP-dependent Clp protease protease subunit
MEEQIKVRFEVPAVCLERYNPFIRAAKGEDSHTINIYSTIGEYGDGSGMTAKIVSSILRKAEGKKVVVNINSAGGDFFEGLAINTLLTEYEGEVDVNVLGMAASAASIIAMAGDNIAIAKSGFIMIHNAWTIAIGNRNDMKKVAEMLTKFDGSMQELYAKKTGLEQSKIAKMMNDETWITAKESLEMGFATLTMGEDEIVIEEDNDKPYNAALRKLDVTLAKAGMPRSERRALLQELTGTPSATPSMPSAGNLSEALSDLLKTINK